MGNEFAYTAIFVWPIFSIWLYKKKNIQLATLWVVVGGYMILPVGTSVDLPLIPPLEKNSIPMLFAILGCWLIKKQPIKYFSSKGWVQVLVVSIFIGVFVTVNLNQEGFTIGGRVLPGLTLHDAVSTAIGLFLEITPFFIGKQFFRTHKQQLLMFKFLVMAGLLYSIPMLFEVRMSPQLHTWIYGYFPHSFVQQARGGGFRPVVFMGHGLLVSFFTVVVLISALTLWTNGVKAGRFSAKKLSYYFFILLILCKSYASLLYGVVAFFIIKKTKIKTQYLFAVTLVCIAMLYPIMSITKTFPHETIIDIAASLSEDRAGSLKFRFDNESILLAHSSERLYFGWGGWGRNRVYDAETGQDISVTDGSWIIMLGQFGLFGFLGKFGLLAIVVFQAMKSSKLMIVINEKRTMAAHAILVGLIMIDQLPNSSLSPWLWLLAGVLLGRAENILEGKKARNLTGINL